MNADEAAASEERVRRAKAKARRDYPEFYAAAGGIDAELLDFLVVVKRANSNLNVPFREYVKDPLRTELERKTGQVDQIHASLCEAIRESSTFQRLDRADQQRIEDDLFRL